MKIVCVGGGPAGLYFSILMKKANPRHAITVFEQNRAEDTFGWGVVFSDASLDHLAAVDGPSHRQIAASLSHWDRIDVFFKGELVSCRGHGYGGIGRHRLLQILQHRALDLGVDLRFEREIPDIGAFAHADLIVGADGVNSRVRESHPDWFEPEIRVGRNRYIWLGTRRAFEAFTFAFENTEWGWFQLHAYRHAAESSTFIVETREETWRAAGLDRAGRADSLAFCERLFAARLQDHGLIAQAGPGAGWLNFRRVSNRCWFHGNVVLLGDAAHTAHFSIGSGTRLALDDATALAEEIGRGGSISVALPRYQARRGTEALRLENAARNRMEWFENVARYAAFDPLPFSYCLLTGSQRVGHASLRQRDPAYVERVERSLAARSGLADEPIPPMFTPLRLRGVTLKNRVVVSPMAMYSSEDGMPGDFHLTHLGARALGGAGLVWTEMTAVAQEARITPGCAGIWNDDQAAAWARIVSFAHERTTARIGLQLGHAGPKGSTRIGWDGMGEPLPFGGWPLLAASALAYAPGHPMPRAMSRDDMDRVRNQFVAAAVRGARAGFDLLELHCAHGYLLASFLSPLTNQRKDECGGSLDNRLRYPVEVLQAVRAAWPADKPLAVRISAQDWADGGNTADDAVAMARAFRAAGADLIDVSSGQTTPASRPRYGRMYQTPFADRIRNEVGVPVIAVGNITEADQVNTIVAAGRADLCALGRPHLADPAWTLRAAAEQGYDGVEWPPQYLAGKAQCEHRRQKEQERTA